MAKECWREAISENYAKKYYINVEIGKSQWGLPVRNLPPDWEEHTSQHTYPKTNYYFNTRTRMSQWGHPNDYYKYEDENLPPGWEKKLSRCRNVYYINQKEKKSQWKIPTNVIPKPLHFVIPEDETVDIVASVDKGKRVPIKTKIVPPRALKWVDNSCYLDSTLFAFFAGPRDFIDKMLNEDIETNIDKMVVDVCNRDKETDVRRRKRVQKELRKISNSIMRTGEEVEFCTDLRETFKKCYKKEKYHKGGFGDSGEFLTYLLSILSFESATKKIDTYGTNNLDDEIDVILQEDDLYQNTKFDTNASPILLITYGTVIQIPDSGILLSNLLVDTYNGFLEKQYDKKGREIGLYRPEDDHRIFNRIITITTIEYTPYLICSVMRVAQGIPTIITSRIIPDPIIQLGEQIFYLSAVVMHTGGCHYVAIAKYSDVWWYYDDEKYKSKKKLLVRYDNFDDFINEVESGKSNKINPYTHGTQYYYTPIT
jgi:hypothetical protein